MGSVRGILKLRSHGYNSDRNVTGIINSFLLGSVWPAPQKETQVQYCKSNQEPKAGELTSPRMNPTAIILKNGENGLKVKLPYKSVSL